MPVELVDVLGSDLTAVNAARVSLAKSHTALDDSDRKLIRYLMEHRHLSPFYHAKLSLRVKVPLFVRSQWVRHKVGTDFNEMSYRYVQAKEEFWSPSRWRKASDSIKQGSLSESIDAPDEASALYDSAVALAHNVYQQLLELGVAREQARAVLPVSLMTEFIWTGSLWSYLHFLTLRLEAHAQEEIRTEAWLVATIVKTLFPEAYDAYRDLIDPGLPTFTDWQPFVIYRGMRISPISGPSGYRYGLNSQQPEPASPVFGAAAEAVRYAMFDIDRWLGGDEEQGQSA